jgi:hypothetical protein
MAGVKGRSGRKPKLLRTKLAELLDDAWPIRKRHDLVQGLHRAAVKGDTNAAKLLLGYAYGKPRSQVELSGPEGAPLEVDVTVIEQLKRKLDNLARARAEDKIS